MKRKSYDFEENPTQRRLSMDQKKRSVLNFVKSRGELLEYENEYFENQKVNRKRRTKIIATLNHINFKHYDQIKGLINAGVNSFLINMAYCSHDFLDRVTSWRTQLETDFNVYIPITCVLQGNLVRVGIMSQPETFLKKGQEYRIVSKKKIVGDSRICSVDDDNFSKKIGIGAKILIDYGQVTLTVTKIEKSTASLNEQTRQDSATEQKPVSDQKSAENPEEVSKQEESEKPYDIIVCSVDSDCMLKSFKPIFIYKSQSGCESEEFQQYANEGEEEYDDFNENQLTPKDIADIESSLNYEIDSICVSNVRTAEDILAVRKFCKTKQIRVIAKIQNAEGVKNYDEILKVADAVLIARGYLTVHIPVEKLHFRQKEMISKANENYRPVLISCNILDSMVSSLLPTTCEVGEISNLVSDYVDAVVLSGETSYGMYPIQSIETLSRICIEAEARQVISNMSDISRHLPIAMHQSSSPAASKLSVINTIVRCTLDAAYNIQATLIIVFTSTGRTALRISKMRPPCPVFAVTSDVKVARNINYLSSVTGQVFPSLVGTNMLLEKVISFAKEHKYARIGDFLIVTSGEIENLSGTTNNLRIIKVE